MMSVRKLRYLGTAKQRLAVTHSLIDKSCYVNFYVAEHCEHGACWSNSQSYHKAYSICGHQFSLLYVGLRGPQ